MTRRIRVLLVEDTLIAQTVVKSQMIEQGCEVDIAPDGLVALEKAIENDYDLILMDIGLGDGPDGFEVTALIRDESAHNETTPVVAITSHGEADYKEKAMVAGIDRYLKKPFTHVDAKLIVHYVKSKLGISNEE
jgi:CheY-like chemotaxis protein